MREAISHIFYDVDINLVLNAIMTLLINIALQNCDSQEEADQIAKTIGETIIANIKASYKFNEETK